MTGRSNGKDEIHTDTESRINILSLKISQTENISDKMKSTAQNYKREKSFLNLYYALIYYYHFDIIKYSDK